MSSQVQDFLDAAVAFCSWAEAAPLDQEADSLLAIGHLSRLYTRALALPEWFGEHESPETSQQQWAAIYARFCSMPFTDYAQCFDPQEHTTAPVIADLADDLADVWRDLKRGLLLHQSGHEAAACWEWRAGFWRHWGRHAAGALYALHNWRSQQH